MNVCDSFVKFTVIASAPSSPSAPGFTDITVIVSRATVPPDAPSCTSTCTVCGEVFILAGTGKVNVFTPLVDFQ